MKSKALILLSISIACVLFVRCKKSTLNETSNPGVPIDKKVTSKSLASSGGTLLVPQTPDDDPNNIRLTSARHLVASPDYEVYVKKTTDANYTQCFVYKTDNYFRNNNAGGTYSISPRPQDAVSFTSFGFSGVAVDVKVVSHNRTGITTLRPQNLLATGVVTGSSYSNNTTNASNTTYFTLQNPANVSVEIGDRKNPLFIFGNTPEVRPVASTVTHYYYRGYVYDLPAGGVTLSQGQSVYIEAGAVVEGRFIIAPGANNVTIKGQGVINNGLQGAPHSVAERDYTYLQSRSTIQGKSTNNTTIDGIIITNSRTWTLQMEDYEGNNNHNFYTNLKIINWNITSDGIWFDGNYNTVDKCFIFNNDDLITTHRSNHCVISNCTLWGGAFGNLFVTSDYNSSDDIKYSNIDLIGKDGGSSIIELNYQTSGTMPKNNNFLSYTNIGFQNIRIEEHPDPATKFLQIKPRPNQSVNTWNFTNVIFSDKIHTSEGDLNGTSGTVSGQINNFVFTGFVFNNPYLKPYSLSDAHMSTNIGSNIHINQ